jgi:hypothetical protein
VQKDKGRRQRQRERREAVWHCRHRKNPREKKNVDVIDRGRVEGQGCGRQRKGRREGDLSALAVLKG